MPFTWYNNWLNMWHTGTCEATPWRNLLNATIMLNQMWSSTYMCVCVCVWLMKRVVVWWTEQKKSEWVSECGEYQGHKNTFFYNHMIFTKHLPMPHFTIVRYKKTLVQSIRSAHVNNWGHLHRVCIGQDNIKSISDFQVTKLQLGTNKELVLIV